MSVKWMRLSVDGCRTCRNSGKEMNGCRADGSVQYPLSLVIVYTTRKCSQSSTRQRLGADVSKVIRRVNTKDSEAVFNFLSNVVKVDVNMLGAFVYLGILGEFDNRVVVFVDAGSFKRDAKFCESLKQNLMLDGGHG